jgi:hypothetical protein
MAIACAAAVAIRGDRSATPHGDANGAALVEGGPHALFAVSSHPALTVSIGYADLTIVSGTSSQIDVSATSSSDFGVMRRTDPIIVRQDGQSVAIATAGDGGWSIGDDRRVTVVVPPQTRVTVVKAGDVEARGLRVQAAITSVGRGSITVDDYIAPALDAAARGGITLHAVDAARLDASSSEGGVVATALRMHDGSIESDDRVTLGFTDGTDALVTAEAKTGHIVLAGLSGAEPPVVAARTGDGADHSPAIQTVRIGAGHGHIDVRSKDGNIDLAADN